MWHDLYRKTGRAALALTLVAGCAPDGSDTSVPTHPTDTYSVTLEWRAPTTDALGRPLDDLAGYRLYYGLDDSPDGARIELGLETRATVQGLSPGDYLFAVTAIDDLGNESDLSEALAVQVGP